MMQKLALRCWLVVIFSSACFSPKFDDGKIQCGPNDACPPGFECVDSVCRSQSGNHDGGVDNTAPAAPTLASVTPTSPANNNSPTVTGTAEANTTVKIFTDSACTTQVATGTAAMLASPGIGVMVTDNTTTSFYGTATDAAGNASPCSSPVMYIEDSAAPPAPTLVDTVPVSPSRKLTPSIRGTTTGGATSVTLFTNDTCSGTSAATGAVMGDGTFAIDVTVAAGAVTKIAGTAKDAAGNVSTCSSFVSYEHNATAVASPTFTGTMPASPNNSSTMPTIQGTAEANMTVRLYTTSSCTGTVAGMGTTSGTGAFAIGVTVSTNTTTTFYGVTEDPQTSLLSACSVVGIAYTHDTVAPPAPSVTGSTPSPPANSMMPTISGTAEASATVELFTTNACNGTPVGTGTATTGGTFSISVAAGATTTYYARATDRAGNVGTCSSAGFTYTYDATPPAPPTISTIPASPSSTINTPLIAGTAEQLSTINIYKTANCTGPVAASGIASSTGTFGIGITVTSNSSTSITATSTDAAGNVSACSSVLVYVHDSLPPSAPMITSSTPTSPANANSPTISGTAEAGTSVRLYTDATCTTPIGNPATATGGVFSVMISVTDNTAYTIHAQATDAALNASACSTAFSYVEDSAAPTAPTLNALPPSSTNTTPTLTGTAEAGSTVSIYANGTCSGSPTATGAATGGSFAIGVTVTANSSTPFTAKATDAAGNASPCSTSFTYIHDSIVPAAPTGLATTPISPSSSNSPSITGSAEAGSTVRIFTNPSCSTAVAGTATATAGGTFSVSLTVASGSTTTFYATASDAAGNTSACSSSFVTYIEDSTAPNPPTALAATPASPSPSTTPSITGNAEAGSTVKLFTNSACTGTAAFSGTAGGGGTFSIPTTVTANATTTFYATATDTAGNASSCSTSSVTYVNDNAVPTAPTLSGTTPPSPANNNAPAVTGTAEAGALVKLYTASGCSGTIAGMGTATGGAFSITVAVGDNTTTSFYGTATDAAGNTSPCTTTARTYVEDSSPPGTPTALATNPVSPVNANNPNVTGTAEPNAVIRVYTAASCSGAIAGTATATAGGSFSVAVTVSDNSTTLFYVNATDAANNTSSCSSAVTYIEDSDVPVAPVLLSTTPLSPANNNNPLVNGTAEANSTVKIFRTAGCTNQVGMGTATGGNFSIAVSALTDNTTTTFYANTTDAAGNVSPCTTTGLTYVEDSLAPNPPASLSTTPPSPANNNFPNINGSAEVGSTVRVYSTMTCTSSLGSAVVGGGGTFSIGVNVLDNTTTTFYVTATDTAGNASACTSASIMYTENSAAVATPTLTSTTPSSPSNSSTTPMLNGSSLAGYQVRVYTDPTCTGSLNGSGTADASGNFSIQVSAVANATTTFYATANNGVNTSACSAGLSYTHDTNPPTAPTSLAVTPTSPANANSPTISGSAEAGSTVRLYTNNTCTSGIAGSATATGGTFSIPVTVSDNTTTSFYATASDAAGNTSGCSSSTVQFIEDSLPPGLPAVLSTQPTSPSNSNTSPIVNGTAETGSTVRLYTTVDCSGTAAGTGTATGGNFSIQVSVSANSTTTFKAKATDAAGNASGCSTTSVTYTHDGQGPTAPTNLAFVPTSPSNSNNPAITGNAEAGSTVRIYTASNCTGTLQGTGTANGGAFSITLTVAANTTTTFYAAATDAASNVSACSTGITYVEDSNGPNTPAITGSTPTSPSNSSTMPTINGTAEAGSTVSLFTNATCTGTALASGPANAGSFAIVITVTANTSTVLYAKATDTAGNGSGCSAGFTYAHDNLPPGIPTVSGTSPQSPANFNTPNLTGTAEANATILVYASSACTLGTEIATGTAGTTGSFTVPVSVVNNSTTLLYARAKDAAGNTSGCTTTAVTYIEDSNPPGEPRVLSSMPTSPSNDNTPFITGSTDEANALVKIFTTSDCSGASVGSGSSGAGGAFTIQVTLPENVTSILYASASDAAGNTSTCSTVSLTYVEDSIGPDTPTALATIPTSPSSSNMPTVTGQAEAGVTVRIFTDPNCSNPTFWQTTTMSTTFSIPVSVPSDTTTELYAMAIDSAGNASGCTVDPVKYTEDSTANPPNIASTTPPSPVRLNTSPSINGSGEANATIKLYTNSTCSGTPTVGTIDASGSFSVTVSVSPNTSTTFYGLIVDQAGNVSACSSSSVTYVEDEIAPTFSGPFYATATSTASVLVQWSPATDNFTTAANMRYDLCWSTVANGCAAFNVMSTVVGGSSATIGGLSTSTRYYFRMRARDQAGNIVSPTNEVSARTYGPGSSVAVSAGYNFACALGADGHVRCWGANGNGQLGNGTNTDSLVPVQVSNLGDVTAIAAGGSAAIGTAHACALQSTGTVWCWGYGANGNLGNGSSGGSYVPVQVLTAAATPMTGAIGLASGGGHSCALLSNGTIRCWGRNSDGQIGNGTLTQANYATLIGGGFTTFVQVDAGAYHSCGLLANGQVKCWGQGTYGQLGNGGFGGATTPVGVSLSIGPPADLAKQIDLGGFHSCALLQSGQIRCWGRGASGQLGNGVASDSNVPVAVKIGATNLGLVKSIAAGGGYVGGSIVGHTCAVMANGTAKCWGYNGFGQLGDNSTLNKSDATYSVIGAGSAVQTTVGEDFSCLLNANGGVQCFGDGTNGRLGTGNTSSQAVPAAVQNLFGVEGGVAVDTGYDNTCARTSTGRVVCWGDGYAGGNGTNNENDTARPDIAVLNSSLVPITATDMQAGAFGGCARVPDGTVVCWGFNVDGQVGDGTTTNRLTAVPVSGVTNTVQIASGVYYNCALIADGTIKCWGDNAYGQLGDGTTLDHTTAITVPGITTAVEVKAFGYTTCARLADGTERCWGYNYYGQVGDMTTVTPKTTPTIVTGIADAKSLGNGSRSTSCTILATGIMKCWGRGTEGEMGNNTVTTNNPIPVTVSGSNWIHSGLSENSVCGIQVGGVRYCWGANNHGQLGNNSSTNSSLPVATYENGIDTKSMGGDMGDHACSLQSDGTVECWGMSGSGEVGDGNNVFHNVLTPQIVLYFP